MHPRAMKYWEWKWIDATLDNTRATAVLDGPTDVAALAFAIRKIGWEATKEIEAG